MILQTSIAFDVGQLRGTDSALERLPRVVMRRVRASLEAGIQEAKHYLISERMSGGPKTGKTTSIRLSQRTGAAVRAVRTRVVVSQEVITASLFIDGRTKPAVYMPVHEYGAVIVPRQAKKLSIPLVQEAEGRSPRSFPGLFPVTSKKGNLLLARRMGDGIEPIYVLKDRVVIPARRPFGATAERYFPRIIRRLEKDVKDAVEELGG